MLARCAGPASAFSDPDHIVISLAAIAANAQPSGRNVSECVVRPVPPHRVIAGRLRRTFKIPSNETALGAM
jgi:hypothetical protein